MGSGGIGSIQHVCGELFKMMTGINLVHVPYRGGAPAVAGLLGGHVQLVFDNLSESIAHIRAGMLRPLAATTAVRSEALPDLPSVADFVPGYETSGWWGIGAPRNTPPVIIDKLNKEINGIRPTCAAGGLSPGMCS
jgi:tripartite-type tricarboxylate transporter receptor subunit TctC